jgi:hypothetical protein
MSIKIQTLNQLRIFEDSCFVSSFMNTKFDFISNNIGSNFYYIGSNNGYSPVGGLNPIAPLFHTYHILASHSYFFSKIPKFYLPFIPESILQKLRELNISNPEIYFVPQGYNSDDPIQFKPSYWLHPNAPSPIPDGNYAKGNVNIGIFESTTAKQLTIDGVDRMIQKSYYLHDGRISPDHGKLNITKSDLPIAFWTIAISGDKSAVTLHWILTFEQSKEIREYINQGNNTLETLIEKFEENEPYNSLVHTLDFLNK